MDWRGLTAADIAVLRAHFSEPDVVELVAFCSWQYGGPRMLTSFGAEGYKRDGQLVLEALPVRPAYMADHLSDKPLPPIPPPRLEPVDVAMEAAAQRLSPPPAYLRFLAANAAVASTWSALYSTVVEGGGVEPRIKQLQRAFIAQAVDSPAWAPPESASLRAAAITEHDRAAVRARDFRPFAPRERAVLAYTAALVVDGTVPDSIFSLLKDYLSEGDIIEIAFAATTQNGVARVYRALVQAQ